MAKTAKFWKVTGIYLVILNLILLVVFSGFVIDKKNSDRHRNDSIFEIEKKGCEPLELEEVVIGNEIAPLTIIIYNDYESPYCRKFDKKAYEDLKEDYIDKGLVNVIIRDLPLDEVHKNSIVAAQAVKCAGEQEMAEEMHEIILDNKNPNISNLKIWANNLSLDNGSFNECLNSEKYLEEVEENIQDAKEADVTVVPTFFIGEQKLEGVQPYFVMKKMIEEELSKLE